MKKIIILCILLHATLMASAYHIVVDSIYYNFTSDSTLEVTYFYVQGNYIYYRGDIVIPASVTYEGKKYAVTSVGKFAFFKTDSLWSVSLPTSIRHIDDDAFLSSSIVTMKLPMGMREIGNIFSHCGCLKSIFLPSTLTKIASSNFIFNCLQLEEIVCYADTPPVFTDTNINNYFLKKCTLRVPKESVDAYRSAIGWKECKKIVAIDSSNVAHTRNFAE